jgi:hypothetical protein
LSEEHTYLCGPLLKKEDSSSKNANGLTKYFTGWKEIFGKNNKGYYLCTPVKKMGGR